MQRKKIVPKQKGIYANFTVIPQTAKVTATVCGKCLVKMEKDISSLYTCIREKKNNMISRRGVVLFPVSGTYQGS